MGVKEKWLVHDLSRQRLLVVLITTGSAAGHGLPLHAARAAAAEWRGDGELDVGLGLDPDHERGHVHDLMPDPDVLLLDQHAGVVDALGESALEDEGLETPLQEVLNLQLEHVIQTLLVLVKDSVPDHAAHQGLALEDPLRVPLLEREEATGQISRLVLRPYVPIIWSSLSRRSLSYARLGL